MNDAAVTPAAVTCDEAFFWHGFFTGVNVVDESFTVNS